MPDTDRAEQLQSIANRLRIDIINMLTEAGSGHPGGALSAVDIVTVLFHDIMKHDPKNPAWDARDRFILSKGHGVPALYAVLAELGYFPKDELMTLRKINARLQGHPDRMKVPGIEASTGSLGQGLSIAVGMALGAKLNNASHRIYCMIGDGETQAGQIWEAAMIAPKLHLDNLVVITDYNKIQLDDRVEAILDLEPLKSKWESFGWEVVEIDGHDCSSIRETFTQMVNAQTVPVMIIAHTVKGKGVSFMEDNVEWHGKSPTQKEAESALQELEKLVSAEAS